MGLITDKIKEAYSGEMFPDDNGFFEKIELWDSIFCGMPPWEKVKRSGLYSHKSERSMNMLCVAKLLCDEFARECFAEQVEISCGVKEYDDFIADFLDREGFWKNIPQLLSKGFAQGGCCLREYIDGDGKVRLNYIDGRSFFPIEWDNKAVTGGIFGATSRRGGFFYTHFERHRLKKGAVSVENKLFKSETSGILGTEVDITELYDIAPFTNYPIRVPVFQYFKPDTVNNQQTALPLGISVYANCISTLKALDTVFDSFVREYILGKKRIIVPSSCIRTTIDPETGKVSRYFDTDDEVYQALKCDEDKDLKITDNTVSLRVQEHVDGINALLNVLCSQVGLSAGSLSFDKAGGMKTATEVISEESKTAQTMKANKNLLAEFLEDMIKAVIELAVYSGELPRRDYSLAVAFKDNVIIDDNTLIDNNIKLVEAGLKSKVSAIMEVLKCDEKTAKQELEKIKAENSVIGAESAFDPSLGETAEAETDNEGAVEQAEKAAEKTLNGAQTQSLLSVIAQYKQGTLSIGQAVNIISVAIGISKDEAKRIIEGAE